MTWAATQAKAKFSEVLDKAEAEGPQLVRRRKREFYVIAREQRDVLVNSGDNGAKARGKKAPAAGQRTMAEFFRESPLNGSEIDLERVRKDLGDAGHRLDVEKPFVNAWDALAPSFELRDDIEFPRLKGKLRMARLG
ncbi:MAG: type II toxin-antitoxin system prevent-host-death family antitoxin [Acidobacteriaceae bacterium]